MLSDGRNFQRRIEGHTEGEDFFLEVGEEGGGEGICPRKVLVEGVNMRTFTQQFKVQMWAR